MASLEAASSIFDNQVHAYLLDTTYAFGENKCEGANVEQPILATVVHTLQTAPLYTTVRLNLLHNDAEAAVRTVRAAVRDQYSARGLPPPHSYVHDRLNELLIIENVGPIDSLTRHEKEVVVDVHCGVAVLRGANVFAQGVLAAPANLQTNDIVSVYMDPFSKCLKGFSKRYEGVKYFVGNGVAAVSRRDLFGDGPTPQGLAFDMIEPLYEAPRLFGLLPDLIFCQNLPSVVCSRVLDPQPGETILDMCAAPGGKTSHIAALMKNKGTLIALDRAKSKVPTIKDNLAKWSLTCATAFAFDATKSCDSNKQEWHEAPPFPPLSFDRILLDAPCSALGQRPCVQSGKTLKEIASFPALQKRLFEAAVQLLRHGGTLVYSTCTLPCAENEGMVAWALKIFPCLKLAQQTPHIGSTGLPCAQLSPSQLLLLQRFDPSRLRDTNKSCDTDTIGFFIAKFVKSEC